MAYTNIGTLHLNVENIKLAQDNYEDAWELLKNSGGPLYVNLLGHKATLRRYKGEYKDALQEYDKVISISTNLHDKYSESVWKGHKGITLHEQGDYFKAIKIFDEELKRSSERKFEGIWTGYMGDSYRKLGKIEIAKRCYDKAYEIAIALNDAQYICHWLGCKGIVDLDLGQFDQAGKQF